MMEIHLADLKGRICGVFLFVCERTDMDETY